MFRIASILILTLALATPAQAGLKEGFTAYNRGINAAARTDIDAMNKPTRSCNDRPETGTAMATNTDNVGPSDIRRG